MKRFVSALTTYRVAKGDAIVLALYGMRGGTVCTVELTVEQAQALLSQLDEAVALMTATEVRP